MSQINLNEREKKMRQNIAECMASVKAGIQEARVETEFGPAVYPDALDEEMIFKFETVYDTLYFGQQQLEMVLQEVCQRRAIGSTVGDYYNPLTATRPEQRAGALMRRVDSMTAQIDNGIEMEVDQPEINQPTVIPSAEIEFSVRPNKALELPMGSQQSLAKSRGKKPRSKSSTGSSQTTHFCTYRGCSKSFKFLSKLKDHVLTHEPEKIECLYCDTVSKRMRSYKKHHKMKHTGKLCKVKVNGKSWEGSFSDLKISRSSNTPREALPPPDLAIRELHTTIDPRLINAPHNTQESPKPLDFSSSTNLFAFHFPQAQECPVSDDSDSDMASNDSEY